MARKKILWLCSWYPSPISPFNGDFIQRHAFSAAQYNDIHVLHVSNDPGKKSGKRSEENRKHDGVAVTEQIICFNSSRSFLGRIWSYYRWLFVSKAAVKSYIKKNGKPDLVHVHIPVRMGIIALWMKRRWNIPFIVSEHWGIYNDVEQLNYKRRGTHFRNYTTVIFRNAKRFLSVSRFLAEGVNRLVLKKEYEVVPNRVNTVLFNFKEFKDANSFRFIHVSNMVPIKNTEGLLRAFVKYFEKERDAELVMVGDTDIKIRTLANELGLSSRISFRGEVPYSQVATEMQAANCLVMFSNMENSPCVIGEALCCGLPVIATNVGGIPELIDEGNGMLIDPQDEAGLVTALHQMKDRYTKFDRASIAQRANAKFSYPVIGKKFDEIYSEMIERT